jgi:hypothetical protein
MQQMSPADPCPDFRSQVAQSVTAGPQGLLNFRW